MLIKITRGVQEAVFKQWSTTVARYAKLCWTAFSQATKVGEQHG
jgi:hypothetical protein